MTEIKWGIYFHSSNQQDWTKSSNCLIWTIPMLNVKKIEKEYCNSMILMACLIYLITNTRPPVDATNGLPADDKGWYVKAAFYCGHLSDLRCDQWSTLPKCIGRWKWMYFQDGPFNERISTELSGFCGNDNLGIFYGNRERSVRVVGIEMCADRPMKNWKWLWQSEPVWGWIDG